MRCLVIPLAAAAIISSNAIFPTTPASAQGLGGEILNYFVPGAGTAADDANREILNRQSDASVYSQVMHAQIPSAPFQSARPGPGSTPGNYPPPSLPASYPAPQIYYPSPPPMGNRCATNFGSFGPSPIRPLGAACYVSLPGYGTVIGRTF